MHSIVLPQIFLGVVLFIIGFQGSVQTSISKLLLGLETLLNNQVMVGKKYGWILIILLLETSLQGNLILFPVSMGSSVLDI